MRDNTSNSESGVVFRYEAAVLIGALAAIVALALAFAAVGGVAVEPVDQATGQFSTVNLTLEHTLTDPADRVEAVAADDNTGLTAIGSDDNTVYIYNSDSGSFVKNLTAPADDILDIEFSPDGTEVAVSTANTKIYIYDTTDWNATYTFTTSATAAGIDYTDDGNEFIHGDGKDVVIRDTSGYSTLDTFSPEQFGYYRAIEYDPTNNWIALAGNQGNLSVIDRSTGSKVQTIQDGNGNDWFDVDFTSDGSRVVGGNSGYAKIYYTANWTQEVEISIGLNAYSTQFNSRNDQMGMSNGDEIEVYELGNYGTPAYQSTELDRPRDLAYSPGGEYLVTGGDSTDGYIYTAPGKVNSPTIFGTVRDNQTKEGIYQATVKVINASTGNVIPFTTTSTDPQGNYQIPIDFEQGETVRVRATHHEYANETTDNITITSDTEVNFDLDPFSDAGIEGTITDNETGEAVSGVNVTIRNNATGNVTTWEISDMDGRYSTPLENGSYDVTADRNGYKAETVYNVTIPANTTVTQDFQLEPHPFLEGTVRYAENASGTNDALVTVWNSRGVEVNTTRTDEDGKYAINLTEDDTYTIQASKEGYLNSTKEEEITRPTVVDFDLIEAVEEINLKVRPHLEWNETQDYEVYLRTTNDEGRVITSEVTSSPNLNMTSSDPSNLTVDKSEGTVTASWGYNTTVNLTAEYTDNQVGTLNDTEEVVVAVEDISNLPILPPPVRVPVTLGDSGFQIILIATMLSAAITALAGAFAGVGTFQIVMIIGWVGGMASMGILIVATLAGLFIGLNVSQNMNLEVRR